MLLNVRTALLCILLFITIFGSSAQADPIEDFYRTHPVELVVGYSVGGGYDTYARACSPVT